MPRVYTSPQNDELGRLNNRMVETAYSMPSDGDVPNLPRAMALSIRDAYAGEIDKYHGDRSPQARDEIYRLRGEQMTATLDALRVDEEAIDAISEVTGKEVQDVRDFAVRYYDNASRAWLKDPNKNDWGVTRTNQFLRQYLLDAEVKAGLARTEGRSLPGMALVGLGEGLKAVGQSAGVQGAVQGAAAGAAVGTFIPGVGTGIGAGIGGVVGSVAKMATDDREWFQFLSTRPVKSVKINPYYGRFWRGLTGHQLETTREFARPFGSDPTLTGDESFLEHMGMVGQWTAETLAEGGGFVGSFLATGQVLKGLGLAASAGTNMALRASSGRVAAALARASEASATFLARHPYAAQLASGAAQGGSTFAGMGAIHRGLNTGYLGGPGGMFDVAEMPYDFLAGAVFGGVSRGVEVGISRLARGEFSSRAAKRLEQNLFGDSEAAAVQRAALEGRREDLAGQISRVIGTRLDDAASGHELKQTIGYLRRGMAREKAAGRALLEGEALADFFTGMADSIVRGGDSDEILANGLSFAMMGLAHGHDAFRRDLNLQAAAIESSRGFYDFLEWKRMRETAGVQDFVMQQAAAAIEPAVVPGADLLQQQAQQAPLGLPAGAEPPRGLPAPADDPNRPLAEGDIGMREGAAQQAPVGVAPDAWVLPLGRWASTLSPKMRKSPRIARMLEGQLGADVARDVQAAAAGDNAAIGRLGSLQEELNGWAKRSGLDPRISETLIPSIQASMGIQGQLADNIRSVRPPIPREAPVDGAAAEASTEGSPRAEGSFNEEQRAPGAVSGDTAAEGGVSAGESTISPTEGRAAAPKIDEGEFVGPQVLADTTIVEVPKGEIGVDPKRFQFKGGTDTGGVRPDERLEGDFEKLGTGPLLLWEDATGKRWVVNGHHRLDLANRDAAVETVASQIIREVDGYSESDARALGAEINIRDGTGKVEDYARFFRETGVSERVATERGLLARSKGRAGFDLAQSATDNLFGAVINGDIRAEVGAEIARLVPRDEALQNAAIDYLQRGKPVSQVGGFVRGLKVIKARRAQGEQVQGDIFGGSDDSAIKTAEALAAASAPLLRDARADLRAISGASKNPKRAKALGVDVTKPDQVKAKAEELRTRIDKLENWERHPDIQEELREAAGLESIVDESDVPVAGEDEAPPIEEEPVDTQTEDMFGGALPAEDRPATTSEKPAGPNDAQRSNKEGLARVKAAKRLLRSISNNPDIVGRQRTQRIANGKELVAFLEANVDKPLDTAYFNGDQIAYTGEPGTVAGFHKYIFLEGAKAGKYGEGPLQKRGRLEPEAVEAIPAEPTSTIEEPGEIEARYGRGASLAVEAPPARTSRSESTLMAHDFGRARVKQTIEGSPDVELSFTDGAGNSFDILQRDDGVQVVGDSGELGSFESVGGALDFIIDSMDGGVDSMQILGGRNTRDIELVRGEDGPGVYQVFELLEDGSRGELLDPGLGKRRTPYKLQGALKAALDASRIASAKTIARGNRAEVISNAETGLHSVERGDGSGVELWYGADEAEARRVFDAVENDRPWELDPETWWKGREDFDPTAGLAEIRRAYEKEVRRRFKAGDIPEDFRRSVRERFDRARTEEEIAELPEELTMAIVAPDLAESVRRRSSEIEELGLDIAWRRAMDELRDSENPTDRRLFGDMEALADLGKDDKVAFIKRVTQPGADELTAVRFAATLSRNLHPLGDGFDLDLKRFCR